MISNTNLSSLLSFKCCAYTFERILDIAFAHRVHTWAVQQRNRKGRGDRGERREERGREVGVLRRWEAGGI